MAAASAFAQTPIPSPDWQTNQQAMFPTSTTFTAQGVKFLDAVDPNNVWVIGNDWAAPSRNYNWWSRSTNGGSSFSGGNIFSDTNTYEIANLDAIDANTAWVASFMKSTQSQGAIHRTTNGGASWVNMTSASMFTNTTAFTNMVVFLTPSVGIAQGDPVNGEFEIWRTTNGGLSWSMIPGTSIPNPLTGEFSIVNLYYKLGTSYMWFGTNAGRMYRTTDAGITWSVATVGAPTDVLLELAFSSPLQGITYVWNGSSIDVYNTYDGGATWTQIFPSGNVGFTDIRHIPGTGIIASSGAGTASYLSYTSDNGNNWTDWGSANIQYSEIDFVNNTTGWAGSYNYFSVSTNTFSNMWKYSGPALSSTTTPLSAFSIPGEVCLSGNSATVSTANSSSATPSPTYSWTALPSGANFSSPTASAPVITFNSANTYTVALTVNNGFTTNTSYQVINVLACSLPSVNFSAPTGTFCNNSIAPLTNQSTGGVPAPSYSWSSTGTLTFTPSPVAASPSVIAAPGVYTVTLVATNIQGTVSATQQVTVTDCAPVAAFQIADTLIACAGTNTLHLFPTVQTATTPAGPNTFSWTIAPAGGIQPLTGSSIMNYSANATNTNVGTYTITMRVTNASGTSSVSHVVKMMWNDVCTGLTEQNKFLSSLVVYPNPAHGELTVGLQNPTGFSVTLTNILGSVVYQKQVGKEADAVSLDVSNLPRGVYFIEVNSHGQKATRKIIVE